MIGKGTFNNTRGRVGHNTVPTARIVDNRHIPLIFHAALRHLRHTRFLLIQTSCLCTRSSQLSFNPFKPTGIHLKVIKVIYNDVFRFCHVFSLVRVTKPAEQALNRGQSSGRSKAQATQGSFRLAACTDDWCDLFVYRWALKGIYPEFQVIRGFLQKILADLLSYDQIHS